MAMLEAMLAQEKADRIQSLEDQLAPVEAGMAKAFLDLETETNARLQKEREILENLAEESRKIEEAIQTEQEDRIEQQG